MRNTRPANQALPGAQLFIDKLGGLLAATDESVPGTRPHNGRLYVEHRLTPACSYYGSVHSAATRADADLLPDDGQVLLEVASPALPLRALATQSHDPHLTEALRGEDPYAHLASLSGLDRQTAKAAAYSLSFAGTSRIAAGVAPDMTLEERTAAFALFIQAVPRAAAWMDADVRRDRTWRLRETFSAAECRLAGVVAACDDVTPVALNGSTYVCAPEESAERIAAHLKTISEQALDVDLPGLAQVCVDQVAGLRVRR